MFFGQNRQMRLKQEKLAVIRVTKAGKDYQSALRENIHICLQLLTAACLIHPSTPIHFDVLIDRSF